LIGVAYTEPEARALAEEVSVCVYRGFESILRVISWYAIFCSMSMLESLTRKETPPPGLERYCALTVVSRKSPWVVFAPKKAVYIFATLRFIMCLP